jgi:hypothetical protein
MINALRSMEAMEAVSETLLVVRTSLLLALFSVEIRLSSLQLFD